MESTDQFNFNLFQPRNLHGRKNRNVILTMLVIWAVAVFGFQFLLRAIEKPTPEKTLQMFESTWPAKTTVEITEVDYRTLLTSLVLVKGKNTVSSEDQKVLSEAISCVTFGIVPDSIKPLILEGISDLRSIKSKLPEVKDQEYLDLKTKVFEMNRFLTDLISPYSGLNSGTLESTICIASLVETYPESLADNSFLRLPDIMKLYLTHNQSVLTDTVFLGFPFHYFYTAVFLLILFIALCLVYNILIEWRLKKEGIVE